MPDAQPSGSSSFLVTTLDDENGDAFHVKYLINIVFSGWLAPVQGCICGL